jgi:periplasmic protein TonB
MRPRQRFGLVFWLVFVLAPLYSAPADNKDNEEQVYELTDDMTPPRLVHRVNPEYSPGSKGVRVEGSVLIGTVITSRGATRSPHVVKSLDKDVDEVAVEAVKQWVFTPAKKDGKPVAVNVTIEIAFHAM